MTLSLSLTLICVTPWTCLYVLPGLMPNGHIAPCSCWTPLQHGRADRLGLSGAVTHAWWVTWGQAVGWPRAQAHIRNSGGISSCQSREVWCCLPRERRHETSPLPCPALPVVGCSLEGAACAWGAAASSQPCQPCPKSPGESREQCMNCWVQQGMLCLPGSPPWSWGLVLQVAFTLQLGSVHLWSSTAPGGCGCCSWDGGGRAVHSLLWPYRCAPRGCFCSNSVIIPTRTKNLIGIQPLGFI